MKTSFACLSLAVLLAWSSSGAEEKLAGGPYVVDVTQRSATVAWVVDGGSVALTTAAGQPVKSSPALRVEKANFTGLKPGTTYNYEVPGHAEARGSFKTPPTGATPFHFVVYGDTRTRHDFHRKVAAAIMKTPRRISSCTPAIWCTTAPTPASGPSSSPSKERCSAKPLISPPR